MTSMAGWARRDDEPRPDRLLGLAVERSYEVFAHNRVGPSMVVRRGDVTRDDVAALAGPVRSVAAAAIDRWLPHAITTWGTAEDLRALVPRVFELLTAGLLATPPEVVFAKVRQSDVGGWPVEESAAVDDIVDALWLATLTQHPAAIGHPAARVLAAIAELDRDLSPYLDDWLLLASSPTSGEAARRHLGELIIRVRQLEASGVGLEGLLWSPHPAEVERLERWVGSPLVLGQAHR
jgi:hypothetical protein